MLSIIVSVLKKENVDIFIDDKPIKTSKRKISSGKLVSQFHENRKVLPSMYEVFANVDLSVGHHTLRIRQRDFLDSKLWFFKSLNPLSGVICALSDKSLLGLDGEKADTVFDLNVTVQKDEELRFSVAEETYSDGDFRGVYSTFKTNTPNSFCIKQKETDGDKYSLRWKITNIFSNLILTAIFVFIIWFYTSAAASFLKVFTCIIGIVITLLVFLFTMFNSFFSVPKSKFLNKKD